MKQKKWMAFLLGGMMLAVNGPNVTPVAFAAESEMNVSADEVEKLLQGIWTLQDINIFNFSNGSFTVTKNGELTLSGTYHVDTDAQEIKLVMPATDNQAVQAGLPYSIEDGTLMLYNDDGIAMVKQSSEGADNPDISSAEELEAQLAQQPMTILSTEVADGNDERFQIAFSTALIVPCVLNQSGSDIKELEIEMTGWDENNLPVKLKSSYMNFQPGEKIAIKVENANMVDGMKLNYDGTDVYDLAAVDLDCGLAKAKSIVSTYTTYDGTTWTNPLLSTWEDIYVGKKLVEPVIYTDQETVRKVQTALNEAGYECGTPDGIAGAKTFEALNAYQKDNGLVVSNNITDSLLEKMNLK